MTAAAVHIIDAQGLEQLFAVLREKGYRLVGPTVKDGAILYDEIASTRDLPAGWTDEQDAGKYRLKRSGDGPCLATSSARIPGKSSCFRPCSACGGPRTTAVN
jgi:hypothetical protein